ncbi:MAG: hypothetical protein NZT61_06945, partial [Deltaproteobacteria bacterium]|nr:hypothetical protein [Deltaproteobacteria bacterium]
MYEREISQEVLLPSKKVKRQFALIDRWKNELVELFGPEVISWLKVLITTKGGRHVVYEFVHKHFDELKELHNESDRLDPELLVRWLIKNKLYPGTQSFHEFS